MDEATEAYRSTLSDLKYYDKILIAVLTELAGDYIEYAPQIVQVIQVHIFNATPIVLLPVLYLIDSIVKNIGSTYLTLFDVMIAYIFPDVFKEVDRKAKKVLYQLRCSWKRIFSEDTLYNLDKRINAIDSAWPVQAPDIESKNDNQNKSNSQEEQILTEDEIALLKRKCFTVEEEIAILERTLKYFNALEEDDDNDPDVYVPKRLSQFPGIQEGTAYIINVHQSSCLEISTSQYYRKERCSKYRCRHPQHSSHSKKSLFLDTNHEKENVAPQLQPIKKMV